MDNVYDDWGSMQAFYVPNYEIYLNCYLENGIYEIRYTVQELKREKK